MFALVPGVRACGREAFDCCKRPPHGRGRAFIPDAFPSGVGLLAAKGTFGSVGAHFLGREFPVGILHALIVSPSAPARRPRRLPRFTAEAPKVPRGCLWT
jgi:hypothetical protein